MLNTAIFEAVLDELAEVGYARLTMERVAERAGASKASLYRRWPSRMELAIDAVHHLAPDPTGAPDTGSLRGDLLAWMRQTAGLLTGPAGEALRGLLGDALSDPSRTLELRRRSRGTGHRDDAGDHPTAPSNAARSRPPRSRPAASMSRNPCCGTSSWSPAPRSPTR